MKDEHGREWKWQLFGLTGNFNDDYCYVHKKWKLKKHWNINEEWWVIYKNGEPVKNISVKLEEAMKEAI